MSVQHDTKIAGRRGELRYHSHTVALIATWQRNRARTDNAIGTTVATLTFRPAHVNSFWIKFGQPTHVALPTKEGGRLRVYELLTCDVQNGRAQFRTPPCRIEEPR